MRCYTALQSTTSRTITSEYHIDESLWETYNKRLKSLGILVKAHNFLVFQFMEEDG
ncbi:hypothetical protein JHK82_043684 [Glycine max]|nr:hypothetical protein JHK82_043684 [Glycine max]KAG5117637.1 hypothetical protein JHK84_043750 [Glycine max]